MSLYFHISGLENGSTIPGIYTHLIEKFNGYVLEFFLGGKGGRQHGWEFVHTDFLMIRGLKTCNIHERRIQHFKSSLKTNI